MFLGIGVDELSWFFSSGLSDCEAGIARFPLRAVLESATSDWQAVYMHSIHSRGDAPRVVEQSVSEQTSQGAAATWRWKVHWVHSRRLQVCTSDPLNNVFKRILWQLIAQCAFGAWNAYDFARGSQQENSCGRIAKPSYQWPWWRSDYSSLWFVKSQHDNDRFQRKRKASVFDKLVPYKEKWQLVPKWQIRFKTREVLWRK